MKKTFCLLLAVLLLLASFGFAEENNSFFVSQSDEERESSAETSLADGIAGSVISQSYEDLAVTGPYVWQVIGGVIRCFDVRTRVLTAELTLSALYPETEDYMALTSFGDTVTLCAVVNAGPDCRITLYELFLQDGAIVSAQTWDATEALAFLFDQKTRWMEVDLIACAGGLLISALNTEKTFQLYLYNPVSREISELGTQPFSSLSGIFPFEGGLLLSGPSDKDAETEELTILSLPGGERHTLGTFRTGSLYQMSCAALNETEQTLYYFADCIGYRVKIGTDADPEPFCSAPSDTAWLRYGKIAEGWYVFLDEEGGLLYIDTAAVTETATLRVRDLTGADLSELVQHFNAIHPEYLAVVTAEDNPNNVLTAMLNQSADYDAYIINLGSDLYQALYHKEYLGILSESETLADAAETFPERILGRIRIQDKLAAFPIGIMNTVPLLDVSGITALTGLSREEIPTDWTGFLKLLKQIGEDGLLNGSGRCLFESGLSADSFRIDLLSMILQDALLWLNEDENRLSALQTILTPVLQAMDDTDWLKLGLPEEDEGRDDDNSDEEIPALLDWANPEIAVMNLPEGTEYWPLSLAPDGDRLIPQDVFVIVLNPWSAHPDGVIRFTESLYQEMDIVTRMELDASLNEPVRNDRFDEDIEYLRALVPVYEQAIADARTEEEAEEIQEGLDEMLVYLEQYEKNGAWLVSEESIALYRPMENLFSIHGDEFWNQETENQIFLQYADRLIGPEQFVYQLASILQMERMETD